MGTGSSSIFISICEVGYNPMIFIYKMIQRNLHETDIDRSFHWQPYFLFYWSELNSNSLLEYISEVFWRL